MEVEVPSANDFPAKSPALSTQKSAKSRGSATKKKSIIQSAVDKPKQSKSRNGCGTCKKKRLKCDETKPACAQCKKRNVQCEGYKKDFKWKDGLAGNISLVTKLPQPTNIHIPQDSGVSPELEPYFASATATIAIPTSATSAPTTSPQDEASSIPFDTRNLPSLNPSPAGFALPSPHTTILDSELTPPLSVEERRASQFSSSFGSPLAQDGLMPRQNESNDSLLHLPLSPSTEEVERIGEVEELDQDDEVTEVEMNTNDDLAMDDADEEIHRSAEVWTAPLLSPSSMSTNTELALSTNPVFGWASPEMLLMRFDMETCGILSVKDGPTENPWRTLIWPLARDSEALYHAINCMTAFHGAYSIPELRIAGMAHMDKSIRRLSTNMQNMRLDCALATSLALALSEGWDEKISTGIRHLRGAKIMVNSALVRPRNRDPFEGMPAQDAVRLKFLCNTFMYLDVIARLTSPEEAEELNFEDIVAVANYSTGDLVEVDPLMGCATTLFPIIGKVANLVQRVRKAPENSLSMISQARDLRLELLDWNLPSRNDFEKPEDPTSEIQHAIQTAEAYRFATLLFLHQAVPDIPSESAPELAKTVLKLLACVPLTSRTVIVHIFPLFAASCEVRNEEDRKWLSERWDIMIARLKIGNVDSCWNVVREVWRRRDAFEANKKDRIHRRYTSLGLSMSDLNMVETSKATPRSATGMDIARHPLDFEYTARGELHWLGVMSEWNWEVFLG